MQRSDNTLSVYAWPDLCLIYKNDVDSHEINRLIFIINKKNNS